MKDSEHRNSFDRQLFGEWIRTVRQTAGMSQAALAKLAGISSVYVSQIETGQRVPSDRNARLLAEALGLRWQAVLKSVYSLRSREAGELFDGEEGTKDSPWKSVSDIPAVRHLLLEIAGLNLSKKDVEILARKWTSDLRLITALTKVQVR